MPIVKTMLFYITTPDLSKVKKRVSILFDTKTNRFKIKLPDHMADVLIGDRIIKTTRYGKDSEGNRWVEEDARINDKFVEAATFDSVRQAFEEAIRDYESIIKNAKKRKVIIVEFRANVYLSVETAQKIGIPLPEGKRNPDACILRRDDCSFNYTPSMGLRYFICFEAEGNLYGLERLERLGSVDQYSEPDSNLVLDWSEERERFFEDAIVGLIKSIASVDNFIKNINKSPDLLDAWIAKRPILMAGGSENQGD